jgi:hypothetical protein
VARASIPYVLGESLDAGRRGARRVERIGGRAVGFTLWPAVRVYESPPVSEVRTRAAELSAALARDGRAAVDRASARAVAAGTDGLQQLVSGILNHPTTEKLLDEALADPALERLATRVLDSPFAERLTTRLLNSEEMRLVLEYVMFSPELRAALSRQTAGLADDAAASMRSRTSAADATTERMAQQFMRRLRSPRES